MTNLCKKYTSPCLETIKIKDGEIYNLPFHNARLDKTRKVLFQASKTLALKDYITIPENFKIGLVKCRVTYQQNIEEIEFEKYQTPVIKSLQLVKCNNINYEYKSSDRALLKALFNQRGYCDDIIIVKNNHLTDSYFANLLFFNGEEWHTPTTPLLEGTQRAKLLVKNKIKLQKITVEDLKNYQQVGLINALLDMQNMPIVSVENILKMQH